MDLDAAAARSPLDGPLTGLRPYASVRDDDERRWIRGAQAGSLDAMERLYRAHWPRAYRAAYFVVHDAAGAEDIAQESFLAALRALDRFDRRCPFGPWLHRIVINRAIDWSRARALRGEVSQIAEPADLSEREVAPQTHSSADVESALRELSVEHRAVVVLRYLLDYTPGEIARMLDLPRGTVNSRLRRALDRIAESIAEES